MKQSFDVRGGPAIGRENLPKLRAAMSEMGIDGVFIPHDDEYKNEYLPDANERLAWATGFTGSAGDAMVLSDRAVIFVDGRYTLQVADQVDMTLFEVAAIPDPGAFGWLAQQDMTGKKLGYDPRLMSPNAFAELLAAAEKSGAQLIKLETHPVDIAWADRPPQPTAPIKPHPLEFAGEASDAKRARIGDTIADVGADLAVITEPASLAWLFNIRGGDVSCTPLPLGRALLHKDGHADLFVDLVKVDDTLREHLGNGVTIHALSDLEPRLSDLGGKSVLLDPASASAWFFETIETAGGDVIRGMDPVSIPKARKNSAEIAGTTAAHIRDGAVLTRFLHWLDTEAQSGGVTEIDAAIKLESLRDATGVLNDISFETISGAGPNGAHCHYRVSTATNLPLAKDSLYLVDSGGQYNDGTTDVTRTVTIGEPTADMKRHYTLVLKGHIALATVRFPQGTTGTHLDALARHALWQAGLDYDHGTGHGVGVYLGVHEGPQRIHKGWYPTPLMPGMIVSNEPGFYKAGAYGIRIENLQYVTDPAPIPGGEIDMLGFANLTWAPLARKLIDTSLLSPAEHDWVNAYHAETLEKLEPVIEDAEVKAWLKAACAPI